MIELVVSYENINLWTRNYQKIWEIEYFFKNEDDYQYLRFEKQIGPIVKVREKRTWTWIGSAHMCENKFEFMVK